MIEELAKQLCSDYAERNDLVKDDELLLKKSLIQLLDKFYKLAEKLEIDVTEKSFPINALGILHQCLL